MKSRAVRLLGGAVAAGAVAAAAYPVLLRSWCRNWGATEDEVEREIPGDELLVEADVITTRAITIYAPPEAIWPWLVQMGSGRAGAYTYDWIENLFRLDMHSSDEIMPEFQNLAQGDVLPLGKDGPRLRVEVLRRERVLGLSSEAGDWVWLFALYPGDGSTRLVSRNRIATKPSIARRAFNIWIMEPGSLVMERKMLLGIKERAERTPVPAGIGQSQNGARSIGVAAAGTLPSESHQPAASNGGGAMTEKSSTERPLSPDPVPPPGDSVAAPEIEVPSPAATAPAATAPAATAPAPTAEPEEAASADGVAADEQADRPVEPPD